MSHRPVCVSIGLPVYNGEEYLEEALDSLLAQNFEDFELIISDNASIDGTSEICRHYAHRDERVHYSRNEVNVGAAANYNRLVKLAKGRYFKWASHDDQCAPTYLKSCVETLDAAPNSVVLVYPKTTIIDAEGEFVRHYDDNMDIHYPAPHHRLQHVVRFWALCHPVFGLLRTAVLRQTRLIGSYIGSDVALLGELALYGEFWEIPERLFFRRIHPKSSAQGRLTLKQRAAWFDPKRKGPGLLPPLTWLFLGLMGRITVSQLHPADKVRCLSACAWSWWYRRFRVQGGLAKRRLRTLIAPKRIYGL